MGGYKGQKHMAKKGQGAVAVPCQSDPEKTLFRDLARKHN